MQDRMLNAMRGKIIVSCQPVVGGAMDSTSIIVRMALAAADGGAGGLRVEGIESTRALRGATQLPIIGIVKRDLVDSPVRITPLLEDVDELVEAGADIVAYDATQRTRPFSTEDIVKRIRAKGALAMADCARLDDGRQALAEGAHLLGTTLSGYAFDVTHDDDSPDLSLIRQFAGLGSFVIAEGRFNTPSAAAEAIHHGADAVVAGSAITRIEHITSWYSDAIREAVHHQTARSK